MRYCPKCGANVSEGATYCPNCSASIEDQTLKDTKINVQKERPKGLTIIAIVWFLGGLYNIFMGAQLVGDDLEALPLLSDPSIHSWFRFGIPAELFINFFVFCLGLIQLYTIYGLWTGKNWAYKLALWIPILNSVSWISTTILLLSAPFELGLFQPINVYGVTFSIFWAIMIWSYLHQRHVKEYLGVSAGKFPPHQMDLTSQKQEYEEANEALRILKVRYAKGEIGKREFEDMKMQLNDSRSIRTKNQNQCPYCGAMVLPSNIFCTECGKTLIFAPE